MSLSAFDDGMKKYFNQMIDIKVPNTKKPQHGIMFLNRAMETLNGTKTESEKSCKFKYTM